MRVLSVIAVVASAMTVGHATAGHPVATSANCDSDTASGLVWRSAGPSAVIRGYPAESARRPLEAGYGSSRTVVRRYVDSARPLSTSWVGPSAVPLTGGEYCDGVVESAPAAVTYSDSDYDCAPATEQVSTSELVTVRVPRKRLETYTVRVPVTREVVEQYTAYAPYRERRIGTHTVTTNVPVEKTETVRVDEGCWKQVEGQTEKVWVPNVVEKQVTRTVNEAREVEEPCYYEVTCYRPETRQRTKLVEDYEEQVRTREVEFTQDVVQSRPSTRTVITSRLVPLAAPATTSVRIATPVPTAATAVRRTYRVRRYPVPLMFPGYHSAAYGYSGRMAW